MARGVRIFYLCADVSGGVLCGVPAIKAEYLFLILWSHPRCQGAQGVISAVSLVGAVLMVMCVILLGAGELVCVPWVRDVLLVCHWCVTD